jgi:multicomponent Na+:H+ antiporter subunit F
MKTVKWIIEVLILAVIVALIVIRPMPFLFYHQLPYVEFVQRAVYIIILGSFLCLFRILRGPTGADRIVATDILGILIVGLCGVLAVSTGRSWYIDIGIAWALQSYISTLALSKYLEGKGFDE